MTKKKQFNFDWFGAWQNESENILTLFKLDLSLALLQLNSLHQVNIHWTNSLLFPLCDEHDDLQEAEAEPEVHHQEKVCSNPVCRRFGHCSCRSW